MSNDAVLIDFTPPSLKNPQSAKKVADAMQTFQNSTAEVANFATQFFSQWRHLITDPEAQEDAEELHRLIQDRRDKQESFLSALAARS